VFSLQVKVMSGSLDVKVKMDSKRLVVAGGLSWIVVSGATPVGRGA